MVDIIGVKFKQSGKMYYFDPMGFEIHEGDHVIVETSRGVEYGNVVSGRKQIDANALSKPLKGVLRIATEEDEQHRLEVKQKEKDAFSVCLEKIREHKLEMKLIDAEYTFDCSKLLFYFTADGRIDFRELVKDLATVFRTRIELRQIGVRDESKAIGSIGACGRNLCCSQFLDEFVPVSIKMAKEQGLSLNPTKISGACGRLMCCLKYEQDMYEELSKEAPKQGDTVDTEYGEGVVESISLLRKIAKVKFETEAEKTIRDINFDDIKPVKARKKHKLPHKEKKD